MAEQKHYKSIIARENNYKDIAILSDRDTKTMSLKWDWELFSDCTVVAIDAFKKFIAFFIGIFGGRITSYESLLDRARRESVLRIKQQAKTQWYNAIINLRIETSSISKNTKQKIGSVEALAYGTWVKL